MSKREGKRLLSRPSKTLAAAAAAALLAVGFGAGCRGCSSKPSEEDCKKAIENIRHIRGLEGARIGANPRAAVRACRGNSSKKTVQCFITARTEKELDACEGAIGEKFLEQEREAEKKRREELEKEKGDSGKEPETKDAGSAPNPGSGSGSGSSTDATGDAGAAAGSTAPAAPAAASPDEASGGGAD